jgi:septal ring-binding cell division protein DamX
MAEEGVHEIQLNGKQLVFMFMATTVVAVVIFLSGVMVGRGVPARRAAADAATSLSSAAVDPTAPADTGRAAPSRATGSSDAPLTAQETLTYAERLEAPTPPRETLKDVAELAAPPPPAAAAAAVAGTSVDKPESVAAARAAASAGTDKPALTEPAGAGWAVQVMAVPAAQRADAEALARRLEAKGYPSYVVPRGNRFAVRVGKYPNQREAEAVSARLKKEEQFDPWVTR